MVLWAPLTSLLVVVWRQVVFEKELCPAVSLVVDNPATNRRRDFSIVPGETGVLWRSSDGIGSLSPILNTEIIATKI